MTRLVLLVGLLAVPSVLSAQTDQVRHTTWPAHGLTVAWTPAGSGVAVSYLPFIPDLRWELVGSVDLDADGLSDLIWRHTETQAVVVWYLSQSLTGAPYLRECRLMPALPELPPQSGPWQLTITTNPTRLIWREHRLAN